MGIFSKSHQDILNLGRGYSLDSAGTKLSTISLSSDFRKRHLWCFGTTGVGKTRLIESILEQDIPAGKTIIFIDPKGDNDILDKIVYLAHKSNRLEDFMLFTPVFPRYSVHFNPLKHFYMLEEQVGHIISGVAAGRDPFFQNVAYELSLALVMAYHMETYGNLNSFSVSEPKLPSNSKTYSLLKVLEKMSHAQLEALQKEVEKKYIDKKDGELLSSNLRKIVDSGADYYNKVSSSLRVALMEECNGNIGQVVGQTTENPLIDRLEQGKSAIFVAQLGTLLTRRPAYTAGKVILSAIQSFVGRVLASGKVIKPALSIHIDEAHSIIYQGVDELFSKGGSANVYLHGYCQSVNQMFAAVDKDYANSILDNCNTKVFLRVPDSDTANYVSKHFGKKTMLSPVIAGDGSMTFRDSDIERVKPEDVLGLQPRRFFMLTYSGIYKGITLDVAKSKVHVRLPDKKEVKEEMEDTTDEIETQEISSASL